MSNRTVLIDADITMVQVAAGQEEVYEFNGRHVLHSDLKEIGRASCRERVCKIV